MSSKNSKSKTQTDCFSQVRGSFIVVVFEFGVSFCLFLRCDHASMWNALSDCRPSERLSVLLRERRIRVGKQVAFGKRGQFVALGRNGRPRGVKRVIVNVPMEKPTLPNITIPHPCSPFVFKDVALLSAAKVSTEGKLFFVFDSVCLKGAPRRTRVGERTYGRAQSHGG